MGNIVIPPQVQKCAAKEGAWKAAELWRKLIAAGHVEGALMSTQERLRGIMKWREQRADLVGKNRR